MATVTRTIPSFVVSSTTGGSGSRIGEVDFTYDDDEPLIVTLYFGADARGPVEWWFARELLAAGLEGMSGMHEVTCWTDGDWYFIGLSGPDGQAAVRFDADEVRAFLIDAEDLVGYGSEVIDFDAELDALLKDGAR